MKIDKFEFVDAKKVENTVAMVEQLLDVGEGIVVGRNPNGTWRADLWNDGDTLVEALAKCWNKRVEKNLIKVLEQSGWIKNTDGVYRHSGGEVTIHGDHIVLKARGNEYIIDDATPLAIGLLMQPITGVNPINDVLRTLDASVGHEYFGVPKVGHRVPPLPKVINE